MGAKSGSKATRHAKQNGGKSGKNSEPKEPQNVSPDLSVLRKPVDISVPGLSQVVKVLQTGTIEVQHILSCECDIIYECKVCRNLFRSLANLISHKRVYCTQLYSNLHHSTFRKDKGVNDSTVFVQPEEVGDNRKETWVTNDGVGEKKGRNKDKAKAGPFRITIKKDLTSIVEKLMEKNVSQSLADMVNTSATPTEYYENVEKQLSSKSKEAKEHTIHLEAIENSTSGIFQTVSTNPAVPKQLMKSQVADLEKLLSETEAVLGPDGKVVENGVGTSHPNPNPPEAGKKKDSAGSNRKDKKDTSVVIAPESAVELYCNICKIHFSSYKTLNHHMKSFHMTFRRLYPCPCCKLSLSNSWSVFRHLLKVHRKTNDQVRRLREQVMKKAFVTQVLQSGAQKLINPSKSSSTEEAPNAYSPDPQLASKLQNQENKAWMDQFEDEYDLQRCGGCGRRFERRAALAAHSQICHKRSQIPGHSQAQSAAPAKPSPDRPTKAPPKKEDVAPPASAAAPAPTPLPPLLPIIHANFNALKENQRASLPASTLFHPAHLSHLEQVKNEVPSKKIEIQVRMDYGKGNNMTPEYRARTPSICRSDEGVTSSASVCKSEDASTSSDNNGEISDASVSHKSERGAKADESRTPPRKPFGSTKAKKPEDREGGAPQNRYPARRSCSAAVNGVAGLKRKIAVARSTSVPPRKAEGFSDLTPAKSSDGECSDDGQPDAKRTKPGESPCIAESEGDDDAERSRQRAQDENEAKIAAMTNIRTLQCLTCKKKYKTLGNLRRHVAIHIGWFRFRCMACDFKCFAKYDCVNHALGNHVESWEKHKAMAFVVDMQLESGGSHDPLSSESVADSADSEATSSDTAASSTSTPDKEASACDDAASSNESADQGAGAGAGARTPPIETAIQATN